MPIAAVDIGNDAVKAIFEGERLYIPNVIAVADAEREWIAPEKDPLEGLHCEIVSGALSQGKGVYAVGKLATKYADNDELTEDSDKATSDQSVILLLTTLALYAAKHGEMKDGVIEVSYFLSTGLPLREVKRKLRKTFRERLKNHQHEVTFLQTPGLEGKRVRIRFEDVLVNTEGHAAMVDLAYHKDGSPKNEDLLDACVLIVDIGGLSTDSAVIEPSGSVDNVNSDGLKQGVSPYLDRIIERVEDMYGYPIRSRRKLIDVLTNEKDRYQVYVKGARQSIKALVDEQLERLAREEYKHIQTMWHRVPEIRFAYLIGGGSILLKPYLQAINEAEDQLPLRFVEPNESIWMVAQAYWKLAEFTLAGAV